MKRDEVSFCAFVASKCPICGRRGCLREITPYKRGVVELFPDREGEVLVARFLCRKKNRTASLLPLELVPYHRYTLRSLVMCLLLFRVVWGDPERILEDIWNELPPDNKVTVYLVRYWLKELLRGLRRAHAQLRHEYGLEHVRTEPGWGGKLNELHDYFCAFGIRGPPAGSSVMADLAKNYSRGTQRFLVGRPSQERQRHG